MNQILTVLPHFVITVLKSAAFKTLDPQFCFLLPSGGTVPLHASWHEEGRAQHSIGAFTYSVSALTGCFGWLSAMQIQRRQEAGRPLTDAAPSSVIRVFHE